MAPTPYPRNLMHSGAALPLTLKESLAVPPTGDITLVVDGNATTKGWPTIPAGESIVVTVGRGTLYESKYLVSSLTASTDQTSLLVLEVDRAYDGTTPVNAPSGTIVEHTISATEMQQINTHMRSKQAHGSDGDLVDEDSVQTLTNKTLTSPTLNSPTIAGAVNSSVTLGNSADINVGNGSVPRSVISNGGATAIILTPSNASGTLQPTDRFMYNTNTSRWEIETDLDMNSHKLVEVADGTDPRDAVTVGQLSKIGLTWQFNITAMDSSTNLRYSVGLSQGSEVTITGSDYDTLSVAGGYIYRVRANVHVSTPLSADFAGVTFFRNGNVVHQGNGYARVPGSMESGFFEWAIPVEATLTESSAATYQIRLSGLSVKAKTNTVTVTIVGYAP